MLRCFHWGNCTFQNSLNTSEPSEYPPDYFLLNFRLGRLLHERNTYLCENGPNLFLFLFFQSYGNENGPDSYSHIHLSVRNNITNGFGAQICLHQRKTVNGFHTRRNCYYIWPITLLELKHSGVHNHLCQNTAAIAKGMVEMRSIAFYSREERGRWRQRPEVLEMLKVKEDRCFFLRLDDDSPKAKWMRHCIPELTTRRHRGRSHAPRTVAMLRQSSQSIRASREAYTFRRRFCISYVFSWAPLLVGDTAEVVSSSATTKVKSLIPHNYILVQYIRWCTQ